MFHCFSTETRMPLSAGVTLGPYEIRSLIGVGGMGEVYKARDTRLDRTVALKLLPAEFAIGRIGGSGSRPRRARSRRSASAHLHVVRCRRAGRPAFFVMEHLEGETLDDRLTRGPLSAKEVLRYASQIADALDHAHREHIVHRDLKPSNVMLTHRARSCSTSVSRGGPRRCSRAVDVDGVVRANAS